MKKTAKYTMLSIIGLIVSFCGMFYFLRSNQLDIVTSVIVSLVFCVIVWWTILSLSGVYKNLKIEILNIIKLSAETAKKINEIMKEIAKIPSLFIQSLSRRF